MCDPIQGHGLDKREFMRSCALGFCGLVVGSHHLSALARMTAGDLDVIQSQEEPGSYSKEALFYEHTEAGLRCLKCPNACMLESGEVGFCRNRVNYKEKMYSIAYGNPCAVHIDPIEKKPFFHFLPSTRAFSVAIAGCNFRCLNCQNFQISQVSPRETENYDLLPPAAVDQCLANDCESIAYTYSEPTTFYEYALETSRIAREKGIRNLLKSNGYINERPLRLLAKNLDAANIDLKSFDDNTYMKLSQGHLAPILKTLKVLKEEGVWLEVTNLLIPGWTDDLDTIKRMCDWLCANGLADTPLHFSRFIPLYKLTQLPITPVSTMEQARELALKTGLKYVYLGNIPAHQAENTYCPKCGRMIVERRGFSILANHIVQSKCEYCKERIPGVWA